MYAVNAKEIEPVCEELDVKEDGQRKTLRATSPFTQIFNKIAKDVADDSNKLYLEFLMNTFGQK